MTPEELKREALLDAAAIVRLYVENRFAEGTSVLHTTPDYAELADAACDIAAGLLIGVSKPALDGLFDGIIKYAVNR